MKKFLFTLTILTACHFAQGQSEPDSIQIKAVVNYQRWLKEQAEANIKTILETYATESGRWLVDLSVDMDSTVVKLIEIEDK